MDLFGFFRKENHDTKIFLRTLFKSPETIEERRGEALDYLVEKHFQTKEREEECLRRLESYGFVRRWFFKKSNGFRYGATVVKELMVKPSIMVTMIFSTALSVLLGIIIGPQVVKFTAMCIPNPAKYVVDVLILLPTGFSPGIASVILNYHFEKKKMLRMLENYGLEI